MKKLFFFIATALVCFACNESKTVTVTVTNPTAMERAGEMVEVSMSDVTSKLQLADTAQIIVLDADGQQVPYQITYDEKVIFPATVKANGTAAYTIQAGVPAVFDTKACGRYYPERVDDVAWENDLVAFRAYGPALQATGERAFGYDVWTKYNTTEPVVEARYASELNPETKAKIDELKKTDPKAASELYRSVSYHVDHGNGMDCYAVGPTLGGGTAALFPDSTIVYPYCYKDCEILDNGPLRFTAKLVYNPLVVKGDSSVIETRIISLDKGSQLNKTVVSFDNLQEITPVVTGIVLHKQNPMGYSFDADAGYIAYADSTENAANNNGVIYIGAVFPATVKGAFAQVFSELERKERGDALGHVLAVNDYEPGAEYIYYWGSGWSKYGFEADTDWNKYLEEYARKIRNPLAVAIK